ncbi:hypothetical protein B6U96_12635 [Archaeoglobales archaeon ex4484_92]|nr:MAG: hypothetical protein B6U96_12635 [Archaeoglobales archaeon ex4484_92]
MNIDDLILIIEKNKLSLSKIDDDFYEKMRERIEELELKRKSGDETEFLRVDDELRALKRIQKKIFEVRTGRIINAAWAEVCGQFIGDDVENMISEERDFFKKLIDIITEFKIRMLEGRREKRELVLVRLKRNVEIQGVDGKKYKLRREDIVTLPPPNADTLIKAGFAEKIEVNLDEISQEG